MIPERITFDLNLTYLKNGEEKKYKNIVIAEVKRGTRGQHSDFIHLMQEHRIMPCSFSKYCYGICQFYPRLKYNRFKPQNLVFERKCNGDD